MAETFEPFTTVQPWEFEPAGRSSEPRESISESVADTDQPSRRRHDLDSEEWESLAVL